MSGIFRAAAAQMGSIRAESGSLRPRESAFSRCQLYVAFVVSSRDWPMRKSRQILHRDGNRGRRTIGQVQAYLEHWVTRDDERSADEPEWQQKKGLALIYAEALRRPGNSTLERTAQTSCR